MSNQRWQPKKLWKVCSNMKRNKKPVEPQEHNIWPGGTFALVITAVIVLLIMIIAWALPEASDAVRNRGASTATPVPVQIEQGTGDPVEPEDESITTAESVGYGDGIIVFSAGLIVLVLALVLRELVLYRKHVRVLAAAEPVKSEEKDKDEPAG
jgi:hypothetical protein